MNNATIDRKQIECILSNRHLNLGDRVKYIGRDIEYYNRVGKIVECSCDCLINADFDIVTIKWSNGKFSYHQRYEFKRI